MEVRDDEGVDEKVRMGSEFHSAHVNVCVLYS